MDRAHRRGPVAAGANQETFGGLWAGYDHGFNDWVKYKVTELELVAVAAERLHDDGLVLDRRRRHVDRRDNAVTAQYGKWSYTPA